jgi:Xaa-Pro aminopeptidase
MLICLFPGDARKLGDKIKSSGGSLVSVSDNLIDLVWAKERPARPNEKVKIQPMEFAGKSFESKIEDLRKELEKRKKSGIVICAHFPNLLAVSLGLQQR